MTNRTDALASQVLALPSEFVDIDDAAWTELEHRFTGPVHPALRRVLGSFEFTDCFPFQVWLPAAWKLLSNFSGQIHTPDFVVVGERQDDNVPTGTVFGVEWNGLATTNAALWSWTEGTPRLVATHLLEHPSVATAISRQWLRK